MGRELTEFIESLVELVSVDVRQNNTGRGGWDITLRGFDTSWALVEATGHWLFLQGVEETIRAVRIRLDQHRIS